MRGQTHNLAMLTHSICCITLFLFHKCADGPNIRDKGAGWNHNKVRYVWGTDAGVNPESHGQDIHSKAAYGLLCCLMV